MGRRPTLHNDCVPSVETHLFGFAGELYGRPLTLELHKKLRSIQRFDDLTRLLEQIGRDCAAARAFWGLSGPLPVLRIDEAGRRALLNGRAAALTPKEYQLLRLLSRAPGAVLTKEEIYQTVWREPANGCLHAVENTVFQLRKKLRPLAAGQDVIETAVGYGYRLAAEVRAGAD